MTPVRNLIAIGLALMLSMGVSAHGGVKLVCAEVSAGVQGHANGTLENVGQSVIGVSTGNVQCLMGVLHCLVAQPVIGEPAPINADPEHNTTLSKTKNNIITLVFDEAVSLPGGAALSIKPLGGIGEYGGSFAYSLTSTNIVNDTLLARESGPVLTNQTWYRVTPGPALAVQDFALELCTLIGDADASGQVKALDLGTIWAHKNEVTEARYDIDGSGQVKALDLGTAWAHKNEAVPAKP